LMAATLDTIREENYQPLALKLGEATDVAKGMLAECRMKLDRVSGLPPERREEETQRFDKDLEFIRAIVEMLDGVADGVIEGGGGDHEEG